MKKQRYYIELDYFGHHAFLTAEETNLDDAISLAKGLADVYAKATGGRVYENDEADERAGIVDVWVWRKGRDMDVDEYYANVVLEERQ